VEGANCSYRLTWFGGSNLRSHRVVQDSRYSTRQSNFEQKSIIYGQKTITNLVTWWSSRWSSIWRRVQNLWSETELFLPIGGAVFRKTKGSLIYWVHRL